jgi:hypothetical protein
MVKTRITLAHVGCLVCLLLVSTARAQEKGFPFILPKDKPNRKLSAATIRRAGNSKVSMEGRQRNLG